MASFRLALIGGLVLVVALALLRVFPVALVAAALLVPLTTILFVIDVDVYEDEPLRVLLLTAVWGAVAGVLVGVLTRAVAPASAAGGLHGNQIMKQGVVLPVVSVVAMLAGPLILLPYRKFNDVLDGATFGVTSAATFAGALVLTNATSLFSGGLRPLGPVGSWVAYLLILGFARPILFAAVIGAAAGGMWLRYRAPVGDRYALGPLGNPVVAIGLPLAVAVVAALAQIELAIWMALIILVFMSAAALVWLRIVIHIGLREEARERGLGDEIVCVNCRRPTPAANFCIRCGVSLLASPKPRGAPGLERTGT